MMDSRIQSISEDQGDEKDYRFPIVWIFLLVGILIIGAYFRFIGLNWDDNQHLHPDERFLTMVETAISPVPNISDYFNTATSSLNPANHNFSFYVYGTLPLFIVRYVAEWIGKIGFDQVNLVGRVISGLFDLLTVILVFLIAERLFKKIRLGLLAAAFSAMAVLQIQSSHYFTVDSFTTFFGALAFYVAIWIQTGKDAPPKIKEHDSSAVNNPDIASQDSSTELPATEAPVAGASARFPDEVEEIQYGPIEMLTTAWETVIPYVFFGIALGMATASKINAAAIAIVLPIAVLVRYAQLSSPEKKRLGPIFIRNIVIAAIVSLLVFRIFQPYAFQGPGFFGLLPDKNWINSLLTLRDQTSGNVDFPPALQWVRRPVTFAWTNMVEWGLGLPLGLLAWGGFLWMAWRIIKGEWKKFTVLWGWTLIYFVWQSLDWTRSMRYQLLIYPTLEIIAAWAIFNLWKEYKPGNWGFWRSLVINWQKSLAIVLGAVALLGSFAWAFAFTRIYTRPITRVTASQWIYQNVPTAINLHIDTPTGIYNQPLGYYSGTDIAVDNPIVMVFNTDKPGVLQSINFAHVVDQAFSGVPKTLQVFVFSDPQNGNLISTAQLIQSFSSEGDPRGRGYSLNFDTPVMLDPGKQYSLVINAQEPDTKLELSGSIMLELSGPDGLNQVYLPDPVQTLKPGDGYTVQFEARRSGVLSQVYLPMVVNWEQNSDTKTLSLSIYDPGQNSNVPVASAELKSTFLPVKDPRGQPYTFQLDHPLTLKNGQSYTLTIKHVDGPGAIALYGSRKANESSWDDPLPLPLDGYSPYDYNYGLYRSELDFDMYSDDNQAKLQLFETNLDQADYIFISSNRQWGSTTRLPERYPLTSAYYRNLLGCPLSEDIYTCYATAQPGMDKGTLGFELVKVFQSNPNLGLLQINDQFAEEAFTVYDHPKVLIFKKQADYNPEAVRNILSSVDLSMVVHVTPLRAVGRFPGNLLLPERQWVIQQLGGTWSALFNWEALQNRIPFIGLILWYLAVSVLGWVVYPFVRLALGGLADRGFPFVRLVGIALLAYLVWLLGSFNIPVTRSLITGVFAVLLVINVGLYLWQKDEIQSEWRNHRKYYLMVELLILAFFIFDLLIRLGNPDLWHPYKGGEKPMDFSYLNAVIKSTTFPPYDPWFAQGYINYYYYGFVLVGVIIKWLGIIPSIAYNLFLPTFFSLVAIGAFSVGWNLLHHGSNSSTDSDDNSSESEAVGKPSILSGIEKWPFLAGIASSLGLLILGNLGTVRMIWHGFQKLAAPGGNIDGAGFFVRWGWTFQGIGKFLSGVSLPYGPGDWYWIPSRTIPGEPITEFPFFTFLYADPHAHLFALPLTILAVAWGLSILKGRWRWGEGRGRPAGKIQFGASFLLGGLVIGSLYPTNTWDLPTYLTLATIIVLYTIFRYYQVTQSESDQPEWIHRILKKLPAADPRAILLIGLSFFLKQRKKLPIAALSAILLIGLSFLLYQPYFDWYGQAYNMVDIWKGDHTPFWSYMTHWGLFMFVIVSWIVWETIDWMAKTPASSLKKLSPYSLYIFGGLALVVVLVAGMLYAGVGIAWFTFPLAVWAGILIFRPGQPDVKRFVLFMVGTGLFLTLAVELIVLRGDIGRMNTVFKFYMQAWTLLSLSAAAGLVWMLPAIARQWSFGWRSSWQFSFTLLVTGAALFTILGGLDKITDRMTKTAPHTLDGMAYMKYSTYDDASGAHLDLQQDYYAIIWMQQNVKGSPVIVEANTPEYRWGTRFTIYTGLPGVVGWNWHQRQQRAIYTTDIVQNRVNEIGDFYNSVDRQQTIDFLREYNVKYIIVGELEEATYPGPGLEKFKQWDGDLWKQVYHDKQTSIYEVIQ